MEDARKEMVRTSIVILTSLALAACGPTSTATQAPPEAPTDTPTPGPSGNTGKVFKVVASP